LIAVTAITVVYTIRSVFDARTFRLQHGIIYGTTNCYWLIINTRTVQLLINGTISRHTVPSIMVRHTVKANRSFRVWHNSQTVPVTRSILLTVKSVKNKITLEMKKKRSERRKHCALPMQAGVRSLSLYRIWTG